MSTARKILKYAVLTIALFYVLILSLGTICTYISFKGDTQFLQIKHEAVKSGHYLLGFYLHIFASSIILLVGFFQFLKWVYRKRALHRALGKVYVFGVLFFAAPGALLMTFYINRGTGVFISFILQNSLWVICTIWAWTAIKRKNVETHIRMMRRSYAMAFGAIMLRLYINILNHLGVNLDFPSNYLIIAFASWVPNLIVAEIINWRSVAGHSKNLVISSEKS